MQFIGRIITRKPPKAYCISTTILSKHIFSETSSSNSKLFRNARVFSSDSDSDKDNQHRLPWNTEVGASGGGGGGDGGSGGGGSSPFAWDDSVSSWSTGLTKDHFDGEALGRQFSPQGVDRGVDGGGGGGGGGFGGGDWQSDTSEASEDALERAVRERLEELQREGSNDNGVVDDDDMDEETMRKNLMLWRQINEPGARGAYLKDSEKSEMYKLHKENPQVYTVERLAKDFRIMRQRVVAILWLKELEEEEEKKRGEPLDDSVELLIDTFPEFFVSHDREFHVASLPYKPDFKVMPEGWDGTTKDPDEVHYEISKKEDDMLYEEFLQRFKFNTMKFKGKVNVHKYSRRRPSDGWTFKVEKLGSRGKRGSGGGWKFVSEPDGSTRPLNETEKLYVKRETPRRRRKILP